MELRLPTFKKKLKLLVVVLLVFWAYLFYLTYFGAPDSAKRTKSEVVLIVILFSIPNNYLRRNAIRTSWLKAKVPNLINYFCIGTKDLNHNSIISLKKENDQYGDLMLLNVDEGYENLSIKLLESIDFVNNKFIFQYLFKGDDDTFVNLKAMLGELSSMRKDRLYWGFFDGRANVKRAGKWAERNWVLCDKYLPHARGGGYLITSDLVDFISKNKDILTKYKSEDISMGVWLSALDIERLHDPRFDTEYKSRGCDNRYIVTHKVSDRDMLQLQHNLDDRGRLCEREIQLRYSYNYNWKVLPSGCCVRNDSSVP